jgi:type IV pilus assembly protein PilF
MVKRSLLLPGVVLSAALLLSSCAGNGAAQKNATYHLQMGLSNLGENNITGALIELTESEKVNPDNYELQNYLGIAYFRKNKFDIAVQKYLKALALKPDFSDARNNLGVAYLELKRWDDAIYQFKLVIEDIFYPNQEAATINLALAYYGKGDFPQALSILRGLVGSSPQDPRVRLNLGKVYYALDKFELAVVEYKKAIDLNVGYAAAHYNLALAYMKLQDKRSAALAFKEVVRLVPESELGQLSQEYLDLLK